jgi:chaperonin GroES
MVKPLADYVLLEAEPTEKKIGSIILTDNKTKSHVAKVIAIGPGKKDEKGNIIPDDVKVGQKVLYKEYSTTDYEEGDRKYLLVKNEDIIGIVD